MQTLYACGGGGSQQREVADGADVVFTDTAVLLWNSVKCSKPHSRIRYIITMTYVGPD